MLNGSESLGCSVPLLSEGNFPGTGGDIDGRFCSQVSRGLSTISCCLPCPVTGWVYSTSFPKQTRVANYISIISLICNTFLLLTFAFVPKEKSHRHYLSIGLTVSLVSIALAFVVPLGTEPDFCYNGITPNNMHTDLSCAFTGVLLETGAMGAVVWILLRSILTALRIMIDFQRTDLFRNISIALGVGLPILFMAISLPITGVSYRLGNVCVPGNLSGLPTWFAWILIFAGVSWIIQVSTILYCLWRFASFSLAGPTRSTGTSQSSIPSVASGDTQDVARHPQKQLTPRRRKRIAWRKARGVLILQWRSIIMAFIVVNLTIYFGLVFIQQTGASQARVHAPDVMAADSEWFECLMRHDGAREKCLHIGRGIGLRESRAVGTLILASFTGIMVFLLMVRSSMFVGWWSLIRNPHQMFRRPSVDYQDVMASGRTNTKAEKQDVDQVERQPLPAS